MALRLNPLKKGTNAYNNAVRAGRSTEAVVVEKRVPLAQRAASSTPSGSTSTVAMSAAPPPAGAIGQKADGTYIFPTPPSDAIGQRADGSYILAPSSTSPASSTRGGAGLPKVSPTSIVKGLYGGYVNTRDQIITQGASTVGQAGKGLLEGITELNEKAKDFNQKFAPTPENLWSWTGDAAEGVGNVVGKTAAAAVNPILVPLLLGIGVYAFATSR